MGDGKELLRNSKGYEIQKKSKCSPSSTACKILISLELTSRTDELRNQLDVELLNERIDKIRGPCGVGCWTVIQFVARRMEFGRFPFLSMDFVPWPTSIFDLPHLRKRSQSFKFYDPFVDFGEKS